MGEASGRERSNIGPILLAASLVLTLFSFTVAVTSASQWTQEPTANFIGTIGYIGPALSSGCTSARNPILEPTCLTDLPGGYCYHFSCGMINPPVS